MQRLKVKWRRGRRWPLSLLSAGQEMEEEGRTILRGGGRGNAAVQKLAQRYERMAPSSLSLLEFDSEASD